jgi:hypothetical protein
VSDIDIFDKAYAQNDVEGFIDLISSNEPVRRWFYTDNIFFSTDNFIM